MEIFSDLELAMFSGKGGVGKSTLSCTFACNLAQRFTREKIMLLSTDPAHSLGDILQVNVNNTAIAIESLPNLWIRALDARQLLKDFKARYGSVLELLVERGSFIEGKDLTPIWDLNWPGLDELMGLLEIQRLCNLSDIDRVVVDMAPSGHTLNLFRLMNFLDKLLNSLELFQKKHRYVSKTFTGHYIEDRADNFLTNLKDELAKGRQLLENKNRSACFVVAIPESMSLLETKRFISSLNKLRIPCGGIFINQILSDKINSEQIQEQQHLINQFINFSVNQPIFLIPQQQQEPLGISALTNLFAQIKPPPKDSKICSPKIPIQWPEPLSPCLGDFVSAERRLLIVGGKGGVGKTTVSAAIAWGMAKKYPNRKIRIISIDPAHSLGDAFGLQLKHQPVSILPNLLGQEIDAEQILEQFRDDYLWELAEMIGGDISQSSQEIELAYSPVAWRQIASQALPGIDEMLSLLEVIELLETQQEDLIIIDSAPTGHLLRFLEMPSALADWLAWIFKLWIKYQNVVGKTEFMGRLRTLRKRVINAQKILKDPKQTEFIGVLLARQGVIAEAERLYSSLEKMNISQNYVIINRFVSGQAIDTERFPGATVVRLPMLPRSVEPLERIAGAANCLFEFSMPYKQVV